MKKSELRKIIREIISEQNTDQNPDTGDYAISDFVNPNTQNSTYGGTPIWNIVCPQGYKFYQKQAGIHGVASFSFDSAENFDAGNPPTDIQLTKCVPIDGPGYEETGGLSPGDMAGHGSPDNPFVPGMGFEDQFIDQLTGPGGPFGGAKGGGKGKPIRESKKRRK